MMASPSPYSFPPAQKLEAANFDEKKEINKRKQMILEGKVRAGGAVCVVGAGRKGPQGRQSA